MAAQSYKKWIIIGIIVFVAAMVFIAIIQSDYKKREVIAEKPEKSLAPPGPLMDPGLNRVVPVEELDVDTENPQALAALADGYFEKSQFDQAIEIYKKVLKINPDDVDTYNDLGLAYHYTERSDLAIDILKKGTEIMPSYQRIWLSLGFVQISAGNKEEARSALTEAVELNPQSDVGQEAVRILGLIK
jgi:tetratricopeptide (TPR) repeat protein